ncbi:hypothetical protein B0H13DRAFT_2402181 [Mycena leptocephala]|nr:hypothetical protein B0H13DRAFT_2402181 [Mycena leptocephala]
MRVPADEAAEQERRLTASRVELMLQPEEQGVGFVGCGAYSHAAHLVVVSYRDGGGINEHQHRHNPHSPHPPAHPVPFADAVPTRQPSLSASGSSVSSFPSVPSSFFFSSTAASPPHVPPLKGLGETHGQLIIPELVLPATHVPPQRTSNLKVELKEEKGKTVTRLLVLGSRAATATTLYVDNPSGWVVLHLYPVLAVV